MRESKRGQRKRAQVMVLSCWCHRQIQAAPPPGFHLRLTQYPLYSQYHASLFRCGCLPWCGRLAAPSPLPSRQLPAVAPPSSPPSGVAPPPSNSSVSTVLFISSFSSCPTRALGQLCFWQSFCVYLPSQRPSYRIFATPETFQPFQERGTFPTQEPGSKFSSGTVFVSPCV